MAELVQESQNNITPISGSYLSAQNRRKLFNRSGFSSPVSSFGGEISPIRTNRNIDSLASKVNSESLIINSLQEQVSELNARNIQLTSSLGSINVLQSQINLLRTSVNDLGSTLQQVGFLINVDSQLETQKDNQELEIERKLSQRSIREGKESELERKIQSSLLTPVQEVGDRVQGTLSSLMGFFGTLFAGWLTNQGIEALRASFNDNKRKLNDIKNSTLSNLAIVGGIFSAFKFGIGGVISTIARLSFTVGNFVVGKTIGSLFGNLLKLIPSAAPTPSPGTPNNVPSGKPSGSPPAKPSGKPAGGFGTLFGTAMEAFQGNWLETILGGASFLPGWPGALAKGAFWLEQGLDVFDKGVVPEGPLQIPGLKDLYKTPLALPQSIQLPDLKDLFKSPNTTMDFFGQQVNSSADKSLPSMPIESSQGSPQAPSPGQVSQTINIKPQVSLSPQASDFGFSLDKMASINPSININSENSIDFNKSPLYGRVSINVNNQNEKEQENQSSGSNLVPIQSKGIKAIPFDITPSPEPKPTIIYRKSSTQQSKTNGVPLKSGSATNVPIIASSNSDNMYTLYSQSNYNVMV
jgi:hypothetical protein